MNLDDKQVDAFILHSSPYQESSLILQLFSLQLGRFSVLAKGVKSKRSQARKAQLQPFQELKLGYTGRSELKTLVQCELVSPSKALSHLFYEQKLACAYYASELITRALPENVESPSLYHSYRTLLELLLDTDEYPPILRRFEMTLLQSLGLAPDCQHDIQGNPIIAQQQYSFLDEGGFSLADPTVHNPTVYGEAFKGRAIRALTGDTMLREDWPECLQISRRLLREVIGDKPLQSRKMWQHIHLNQTQEAD